MDAPIDSSRNVDEVFNDRVRFFTEFLDQDYGQNQYKDKISKLVQADQHRLIVNMNHLRQYNREYAEGLLNEPMDYIPAFNKALQDIVSATFPGEAGSQFNQKNYYVGFDGSFGDQVVSPTALRSSHLGHMVSVEGIVTRCSLVRAKVSKSVHYCEATKLFHSRDYHDALSMTSSLPTPAVYPKEDENGNPLTTEFGLSVYRDSQVVYVQEMPERAPAGQLPRPIEVLLDEDLVDVVKPGDRVRVVGVYRSSGKHSASMSAVFRTTIVANNISLLGKEIQQPTITEADSREIRKLAKRDDIFNLLATSVAPSMFGHEYIKKALLLLMMGGVEKNLENGTHLRGDINILLIGDPSVGKSQMLRFVLKLAPLAIATTGRGSSGVGLTAAVTTDSETGERTLEAGAMVLADRGVVCIDEFDKMSDIDRVAIHEVMEQQTVTIAKAGIHTSLNARCSVLAAANPAFGTYLDEKKPFENITLPDSLLSRFDLVFVVLDKTDDEFNRAIADHITRLHRFIPAGVEEGAPLTENIFQSMQQHNNQDRENGETPVFEPFNELLHIGIRPANTNTRRRGKKKGQDDNTLLSIPFLKKYFHYAKNRVKPTLTQEACDFISSKYAELRAKEDGKQHKYRTMPITPRTLETLIRLSTAHARCRLSKTVEQTDAEVAYELLVYALFKEVKPKKREKRLKVDVDDEDSDDATMYNEDQPMEAPQAAPQPRAPLTSEVDGQSAIGNLRSHGGTSSRLSDLMESQLSSADDVSMVTDHVTSLGLSAGLLSSQTPSLAAGLSPAMTDLFRKQLSAVREHYVDERGSTPTVQINEIMSRINLNLPASQHFAANDVMATLKQMSDENLGVWLADDAVMFI